MSVHLTKIAERLMNIELSNYKNIELESGLRIEDPQKFVNSHIEILEGNPGNKRFKPDYERLLKFYNITKE